MQINKSHDIHFLDQLDVDFEHLGLIQTRNLTTDTWAFDQYVGKTNLVYLILLVCRALFAGISRPTDE